ncbi:hypothetical protein GCM10012275_51710 [Longimycelium tulufanense]|uniref:PpiC domain-containing protein n=1 Tax=Longimycelium tulufanense TaxID=907463 RepID=A0A8J3FYB6_9PSEU|nr:SurA N-terminal domain-containing protein [Longimycelium tulufanense]GGM74681.1 hypothetical protein GCM10012275_51710 [Longimycelium tulufanense]
MTAVIRRRVRRPAGLLAAAAVAVGLVAGCGSGPSQVGAAAIVGDNKIPLEHIQQRLDSLYRKEPGIKEDLRRQGNLDTVARNIATLSVRHELVSRAAEREGLHVNEEQVTELIDKQGGAEAASKGTVYDASTFRERARDQLLLVELGRKYLDKLAVTIDFTQAPSREAAERKARQLADPDQARKVIAADRKSGIPAGTGHTLRAADNLQLASTPLFGAEKNTVVAFPVSQQEGQWLVAVIRDRRTDADGTVNPERVDPLQLEALGVRMLAPLSDLLGVRVSPRYGMWDPMSLAVVPGAKEAGGIRVQGSERKQ